MLRHCAFRNYEKQTIRSHEELWKQKIKIVKKSIGLRGPHRTKKNKREMGKWYLDVHFRNSNI